MNIYFPPLEVAVVFQWAPTLGGECYIAFKILLAATSEFQWAPTLGGECYKRLKEVQKHLDHYVSMGTHPWG